MNHSIFGERSVDLLYAYYDVKIANDEEFLQYYSDLTQWLVSCSENKEKIDYKIIHSGRLAISTFQVSRNKSQFFIWDTAFWDSFEQFLIAFFSFDAIMSNPTKDQQSRHQYWEGAENFIRGNTFRIIKNYFSTSPLYISILETINYYERPGNLKIDSHAFGYIKEIISFAKEFVLLHELEHLLKVWAPDVFLHDSNMFINVANYYRDHIVDLLEIDDWEIKHMAPEQFKAIISNVISDTNNSLFYEIYNDYHAFFEVLLHHNENFNDKTRTFSNNLPTYIISLKLLKFFESYKNYVIGVTGKVLSTAHLDKATRMRKIFEAAQKASRAVYERDYLVVELISTTLGLQAEKFNINCQDFYKSIDTHEFSKPYTACMEPIVNKQIKEVIINLL